MSYRPRGWCGWGTTRKALNEASVSFLRRIGEARPAVCLCDLRSDLRSTLGWRGVVGRICYGIRALATRNMDVQSQRRITRRSYIDLSHWSLP